MALRLVIVLLGNKEALSFEGVKNNLDHSHNQIWMSQWAIRTRTLAFFALAMVRTHCLAQQWQHWFYCTEKFGWAEQTDRQRGGIPSFTHSHEGEKVSVHPTPNPFIRLILDPSATWSHTKNRSSMQYVAYLLAYQLRKEVLLPSFDCCYLTMLSWSLNNLPCCSSTIGPCLQSAKSEIG